MTNATGSNGQAPASSTDQTANGQAPAQSPADNTASLSSGTHGQAPTSTQDTSAPATISADDWKRVQQELAEARREAAKHRTEKQALIDASLTEQQKRDRDFEETKQSNAALTQKNQQLLLQIAGFRSAPALGVSDVSAALALIQVEHGAALTFDKDTNEPTNLDNLLKQVIKDHPFLAQAATPAQTTQPATPQATQPPVQTGGAMSPGRAGAPAVQQVPNRPLRTFNDVQWKR